MISIESWMRNVFHNSTSMDCYNSYRNLLLEEDEKARPYMMIPCKGDRLEIPVLAIQSFIDAVCANGIDNIPDYMAVKLESIAKQPRFTAFNGVIRSALDSNFSVSRLVRFIGKDKEDTTVYYGTKSALFDKDFMPLMMGTWEVEKKYNGDYARYNFVKPVLRIVPDFYLDKYDNVGRFVCKKMIPMLLEGGCVPPSAYIDADKYFIRNPRILYTPKVVLEKIPFEIKKTDAPSISTTNEDLIKAALDNIQDIA